MAAITPPPPLVYTLVPVCAVARSIGVTTPEAFLDGGESLFSKGASLVLDFGEERVGVIELEIVVIGTTTLELIEGEDLEEALLLKDPFPEGHWYHQPRDILELRGGRQTARNEGRRAFRFVNVIVHGPGTLILTAARMIQENAPVQDRGAFHCSDALLNDAWEISRRTIRLCMQAFYEDGVKRDGMLWIGDYRVEFLCGHYLFGDARLARRSLEMFAQCRHPNGSINSVALAAGGHMFPRIRYLGDLSKPGFLHGWVLANYCADFISAIWEYVLHTGDSALASELDPVAQGVLEFLRGVDLVTTKPSDTFITDNQVDQENWWGSRPALAYQIAAAFADAAKIADLLGDEGRAATYRTEHRRRIAEPATLFGNPARGESRDDTPVNSTRSWHAHAAAYLAGAVTPDELKAVHREFQHDAAIRRPMAGFMEFYLLQAWLGAGLIIAALEEMRSYYGHMLRAGATTTWEVVDRRNPGIDHIVVAGRSHCHGWSAGAAYHLPAMILGVMPTSPGFSDVSIRPALGDLAWAQGRIPTPHGDIAVSLTGPFAGEVTLPSGVKGFLHLEGRPAIRLMPGETHVFR